VGRILKMKKDIMLKKGFTDIEGNIWSEVWIESYNQYTRDIEGTSYESTKEYLKDNRHKFYVSVLEYYREQRENKIE
jgi:hypothetical protein